MMDDYRRKLINSLAHDLKSPLMSMSGCAENLKENVHTQKREHYVDMIAQNVTYMNHIIDETLELSRLDACVTNGVKAEVDLCRLARELMEKYEPLAEQKKLHISFEGGYTVHADKNEMRSIIDNLVSNAVKYTKESGTVLVSGTEKEFMIGNDTEEKLPQDIEKLWEAFVKGDESRTNRTGSGLGLAIVRACLERNRLHGSICFEEGRFVVKIRS
ncbi:MAG: HAMP domain-containing histidine kinase [Alistipes sp.]|nr:HAMP domain-containing histidine kinase [Alistipes sp.]